MQLEVGKTYLDGSGCEVTIAGFDPFRKQYYSETPVPPSRWGGGRLSVFRYYYPDGQAELLGHPNLLAEKPTPAAVPVPSAPACPTQHRIRTNAEVGLDEPTLVAYGGKIAHTLRTAPYAHDRTVYAIVGGDVVALVPEWVETTTLHSFPDTGTQKSWCSCCDAEGRFDWRAGKYS